MNTPDLSRLKIDRGSSSGGGSGGAPPTRSRLPAVILLLLLLYIGWNEFGRPAATPALPQVTVARVARVGGSMPRSGVAANGYVVPRVRAALSTDISGRLVELRVEEGSRVAKGSTPAAVR